MGCAEAKAPERWSAELVCCGLVQVFGFGGLRDAVSCAHIVQQEVAVGMNDLVADEFGDLVRAAIDARSWWQGLVGGDVADRAADLSEELLSCLGVGGLVWRISSTKRSSSVLCVLASGVSKGVGLSRAHAWDIRPVKGGCETPSSLRNESAQEDIKLLCWLFQPKGPISNLAGRPVASSTWALTTTPPNSWFGPVWLLGILFDVVAGDGFNVAIA